MPETNKYVPAHEYVATQRYKYGEKMVDVDDPVKPRNARDERLLLAVKRIKVKETKAKKAKSSKSKAANTKKAASKVSKPAKKTVAEKVSKPAKKDTAKTETKRGEYQTKVMTPE